MGKKFVRDWIIPIIVAYGIAMIINKFVLFTVYIPSGSMMPTINIKDRLVATRLYDYNKIERGDILVFNFPEEDTLYIKRVVGLPGEKIDIEDGKVFINGELLKEDYVKNPESTYAKYEVPEGHYFFLGDNRINSKDARYWNNPYISETEIKGKAQFRFFPFNNIGTLD